MDSLFRKQATSSTVVAAAARSFTSSTGTTAPEARQVMEIDGSSDVEEVNTISKTNGMFALIHLYHRTRADQLHRQKETRRSKLR